MQRCPCKMFAPKLPWAGGTTTGHEYGKDWETRILEYTSHGFYQKEVLLPIQSNSRTKNWKHREDSGVTITNLSRLYATFMIPMILNIIWHDYLISRPAKIVSGYLSSLTGHGRPHRNLEFMEYRIGLKDVYTSWSLHTQTRPFWRYKRWSWLIGRRCILRNHIHGGDLDLKCYGFYCSPSVFRWKFYGLYGKFQKPYANREEVFSLSIFITSAPAIHSLLAKRRHSYMLARHLRHDWWVRSESY